MKDRERRQLSKGNGKEDPVGLVDPLDIYLKEIGKHPLLTKEQEVDFAKQFEAGRLAEKILFSKRRPFPEKRSELEDKVKIGQDAREKLINSNLRLVVGIAKKYMYRGVGLSDLIQEGNMGLMKAVEKFDYRKGFRFSTYATWWIRQAVARAIPEYGGGVRFPTHAGDAFDHIARAEAGVERKDGQKLTLKELSEITGFKEKKIERLKLSPWNALSLDNPIHGGEEDSAALGEFVEDEDAVDPLEAAHVAMKLETVYRALGRLTPREEGVLRLRSAYTLEEIGKKIGVTRERVRQIEVKAMKKLKLEPGLSKYLEK